MCPGRVQAAASPVFGAVLWNFAAYVDRYAVDCYGEARSTIKQIELAARVGDISYVDLNYPLTHSVSLGDVKAALERTGIAAIGVTPEIYLREHQPGAFTNPDPDRRASAMAIMQGAADVVRELGARYVTVWPGQDGFDYPFQVDYAELNRLAVDGMRDLAQANPDLRFVIKYKPREPRTHMLWSSAARTVLGIQQTGVDNVGVLLDFGHALFGGESPAEAAQRAVHDSLLGCMA
ncbi:sugar phosphate isomerase/epimerase family protein [Actinomyces wuliandei]|nr:TIM barrel protein [Actinomyces wuliandei]